MVLAQEAGSGGNVYMDSMMRQGAGLRYSARDRDGGRWWQMMDDGQWTMNKRAGAGMGR